MTKEEIIRMARMVGIDSVQQYDSDTSPIVLLERFAKLVAEQERKEIISITKTHEFSRMHGEFSPSSDDLVKAIQARDNQ